MKIFPFQVSCAWDDVKSLRSDMEKHTSSSIHFRLKLLTAAAQMQSALCIQDLGSYTFLNIDSNRDIDKIKALTKIITLEKILYTYVTIYFFQTCIFIYFTRFECLKSKVFDQCVLPVISYGTETSPLTIDLIKKLKAVLRKMVTSLL